MNVWKSKIFPTSTLNQNIQITIIKQFNLLYNLGVCVIYSINIHPQYIVLDKIN